MLGAIAGDIIGSVYERNPSWQESRHPGFQPLSDPRARFTDDTVLTVAVADALLRGGDLVDLFQDYARAYPDAGYGGTFRRWVESGSREPYGSWGNGSAMRVTPVAFAFDDLEDVLIQARRTAEVTHDHPEGILGARATAAAIYLARTGCTKDDIRAVVGEEFGYDLDADLDAIRPGFTFDVSCWGTVPPALLAFPESTDYESAVRLAVSLGGDCDTLACIAGAVAEAFYGGVPGPIRDAALARLDDRLRGGVDAFERRFMSGHR